MFSETVGEWYDNILYTDELEYAIKIVGSGLPRAAAVYWAIMKPLLSPPSSSLIKKGGRLVPFTVRGQEKIDK